MEKGLTAPRLMQYKQKKPSNQFSSSHVQNTHKEVAHHTADEESGEAPCPRSCGCKKSGGAQMEAAELYQRS